MDFERNWWRNQASWHRVSFDREGPSRSQLLNVMKIPDTFLGWGSLNLFQGVHQIRGSQWPYLVGPTTYPGRRYSSTSWPSWRESLRGIILARHCLLDLKHPIPSHRKMTLHWLWSVTFAHIPQTRLKHQRQWMTSLLIRKLCCAPSLNSCCITWRGGKSFSPSLQEIRIWWDELRLCVSIHLFLLAVFILKAERGPSDCNQRP
jgi:hypothetical protein